MRLFNWRAPRAERRPVLARALSASAATWREGRGGGWPQGYDAQVRAAALGNAVAQRAIRIVCEGAGSVTIDGMGDATPDGHPALALLGGVAGAPPLIETAALYLLLHGDAFVQIVTDADGVPAMLYPLRPERVTVVPGPDGWPAAYQYRVGESVTRIPAQMADGRPGLIHIRSVHPLDDQRGLGCLGAASGPVAIHNAATLWNKALLDNAARPSGALVYEPGESGATLAPDQFERLRDELDRGFAGAMNAGRPMLLDGGLKWQPLSLTPADMDFINLKAAAAREIALAFGVPPMLLGLPGDNTYANYSEANRALWRLTILPLAGKIVDAVTRGLASWWPDLALAIDLDSIPALASDRQSLWQMVSAADFLTDAEKREMLGFAPQPTPQPAPEPVR